METLYNNPQKEKKKIRHFCKKNHYTKPPSFKNKNPNLLFSKT